MQRISVRLCSAILALSATLGTLAGIAALAGVDSSTGLSAIVFPMVVITASQPALLIGQVGRPVRSAGAGVP
jgi:hypothetical protein